MLENIFLLICVSLLAVISVIFADDKPISFQTYEFTRSRVIGMLKSQGQTDIPETLSIDQYTVSRLWQRYTFQRNRLLENAVDGSPRITKSSNGRFLVLLSQLPNNASNSDSSLNK